MFPNSGMGLNPSVTSSEPSSQVSGSIPLHYSGSEEDPKQTIDERKQKRMLSNRESARRSRMRKQQHLDELRAEAAHLRAENNHMLTKFNIASHKYMQLEEENSLLRSYATDLSLKLQSLTIAMQWAGVLNDMDLDSSTGFMDTTDIKSCYLPSISQPLTSTEIYQ
jgi:hypothetical protein